ncbi:MAG TPA: DUF4124 domain-containing protein [Steroidobacteraceae bacterium]|nr:DUF4124 domain-containing protein [Steroidobacteraceae bacterium]
MLRSIAIGTLILAGAAATAFADVYRWVDEHGVPHYTDQWVPGAQVIKSTRAHPPDSDSGDRSSSPQAGAEHASQLIAQEDAARAVKADQAKLREQQCKDAKDRYEKALIAKRFYKPTKPSEKDEDRSAEREYLSDQEADAYRIQVRSEMEQACGKQAAAE